MNILLVYPKYPDTFWSFKYALKFISKKAAFPPMGLLTVAAMLPPEWRLHLVDMNVEQLEDKDLQWADYVFLSAMSVQRESTKSVIARCQSLGKKVVAGGPLFTASHDEFDGVSHFVLNEAELTLPPFLDDLRKGQAAKYYTSTDWADVTTTPIPLWELANLRHYSSMNIQYSRGCPYDCDFCDITVLYGRVPRTKSKEQILAELDSLLANGWKGDVFLVDDNFIGNKPKLKKEILPALIRWMKGKNHPFALSTEVSINLADDEELMRMMVEAGFDAVFVGIESPNEESLIECKKIPNKNRDLLESVRKIQKAGLRVNGGFIVGFDSDPATIFQQLVDFIQESGIVTAMVGLLNAPRGTRLYQRLKSEGRILKLFSGNNTDVSTNFEPLMGIDALVEGYRNILKSIYSPKQYYARVKTFLREYTPTQAKVFRFQKAYFNAFLKSVVVLGVVGKERYQYWKLFFWSLFTRPRLFRLAITLSIYGFHFRKLFEEEIAKL
ncbi:MAG TPA: B12-binding domain-containing radical SAM protein [Bacteroidota bacterium]|nr:B12-binding domain-containing radical SAM protein [Bacteroidota bacterium]